MIASMHALARQGRFENSAGEMICTSDQSIPREDLAMSPMWKVRFDCAPT